MTTLANLASKAATIASQNSAAILTGLAVTGTVATAVAAVRATPGALRAMQAEADVREFLYQEGGAEPALLTRKDIVKLTWRYYLPSIIIGGATVTAIIGAQSINSKRIGALVAAYSVADKAHQEYQIAASEELGEDGEKIVRERIASKRLVENPVGEEQIFVTGNGDTLCYDTLTGRYFWSDYEAIRKSQNDLNLFLINNQYCDQNELYRLLGLPDARIGRELGWRADHPLDFIFSWVEEGGQKLLSIDYLSLPIPDFQKIW